MFKLMFPTMSLCFYLVGCSSSSDTTGQFRAALEDARAETSLHATQCLQSDSMSAMATEMIRHERIMPGVFDEMDEDFSSMGHCYSGDGHGMHDMMSGMRADDEAHRVRMLEARTLEDQRTECRNHTDATQGVLEQMHGMLDANARSCMMM